MLFHASPLRGALPTLLGDLDLDQQPTVLDLVRLINYLNGDASVLPVAPGATLRAREEFLDLTRDGVVEERDADVLPEIILGNTPLPDFPATRITEASPARGEEMVSPERTVILRFSRPRPLPATPSISSPTARVCPDASKFPPLHLRHFLAGQPVPRQHRNPPRRRRQCAARYMKILADHLGMSVSRGANARVKNFITQHTYDCLLALDRQRQGVG